MPEDLDLQQINSQDLGKEEVIDKVREEVEQHRLTRAVDLIYKFLKPLQAKLLELGEGQEAIKKTYDPLVKELEWLGFSMLGEPEVKGLIKTDLLRVFPWEDYDLQKELDTYLLAKVPILLRNRVKKELIAELKKNEQHIGAKEIEDKNGKKVAPTVSSWLKEYDLTVGSGLADKLKKTEFLYQSKNSRSLTETERENLVKLVDFYEFLKRTSEHPEGVEEKFIIQDEDRFVEVDHGRVVELGPLPEVQEAEEDLAKVNIRHPHIEEFLEKDDKIETHLSAEEKNKELKFKKPNHRAESLPVTPAKPINKSKIVAPTLKEAESRMEVLKPQSKVEIPAPIEMPKPIPKPQPKKTMPMPKPQVKTPMSTVAKPTVAGVKAPQKVLSLTDELEQMTLDEFRNLGADKIREKISLLEQESVEKKAEGIKAWKKSPVNLLYLEIGQDSFVQGRGVREVIKSREENSQPVLTYAEFEDLADLNKSLRF